MRLPNSYGGITKLSGNRRNPFRVRITTGWSLTEEGNAKQIYTTLGYYPTRKAAMMALAEYNSNPYDIAGRKLTFAQCFEGWIHKHAEKYPAANRAFITCFKRCDSIKNMQMQDIRLKNLQDIVNQVDDKSKALQSRIKSLFSKTFKFAMQNDIIQKDYSQFVTINNVGPKKDISTKFFTSEEIKKVVDNLSYGKAAISVYIMLLTGVRIMELLDAKLSDIDIEKRTWNVHGTKTKAANRLVPIHKDIIPIMKDLIEKNHEYLIEDNRHRKFYYTHYMRIFFKPFMDYLGLEKTPHACRHTFISLMDKCGVSASSVALKRIVGHANSSVTEHYTHKEIDELIACVDKLKI